VTPPRLDGRLALTLGVVLLASLAVLGSAVLDGLSERELGFGGGSG
jgi:hypothetical protein